MIGKRTLALVGMLTFAAGLATAWSVGHLSINLDFAGALPDQVTVKRECFPKTVDAVYVARSFEGAIALQVVPGGCPPGYRGRTE